MDFPLRVIPVFMHGSNTVGEVRFLQGPGSTYYASGINCCYICGYVLTSKDEQENSHLALPCPLSHPEQNEESKYNIMRSSMHVGHVRYYYTFKRNHNHLLQPLAKKTRLVKADRFSRLPLSFITCMSEISPWKTLAVWKRVFLINPNIVHSSKDLRGEGKHRLAPRVEWPLDTTHSSLIQVSSRLEYFGVNLDEHFVGKAKRSQYAKPFWGYTVETRFARHTTCFHQARQGCKTSICWTIWWDTAWLALHSLPLVSVLPLNNFQRGIGRVEYYDSISSPEALQTWC